MKGTVFYCLLFAAIHLHFLPAANNADGGKSNRFPRRNTSTDSLPEVLPGQRADLVNARLRNEAVLMYGLRQLPDDIKEWERYKPGLKKKIIEKAGIVIDHQLPLDIRENGVVRMNGYSIKNIAFQTSPGVYATANLFIPDGKGPFPAVITMMGHNLNGHLCERCQAIGHSLALNGYVSLGIDPWGAGERTTVHGQFEYHGGCYGASLMNLGETLLGRQVVDNMRGVDLLCSLPYVDADRIGATGASGGGNQTMWLTALDERIKAAVPVVSVGSFESYVMRSNCICELLPDGLTLTEESGILALVAPRAIKMCNHNKDANPAFFPSEMIRSVGNARPVFKLYGAENNIDYKTLDLAHGYWPEDRQEMLGWFDLHLKGTGNGAAKKEIPFETLPDEKLMVYPTGKREPGFAATDLYAKKQGALLRTDYLNTPGFNAAQKKQELKNILRIDEYPRLKKTHTYAPVGGWERMVWETADKKLIPVLHRAPLQASQEYVLIVHPKGKQHIEESVLNELKKTGKGIAILDLSGTGETLSGTENIRDKNMALHQVTRSELWLGKTLIGEWVKELSIAVDYIKATYKAKKIGIDGTGEAGLAALFLSALEGKGDYLILREAPVSYLFDNRASVDFYSMAIHLPGFLKWGDVSLAAALSGKNITMINPLTMSGRPVSKDQLKEYRAEFDNGRYKSRQPGKTIFMEERR
ncbi:MAG: acetylxylan esterase [Chitinophagaceae bacterium]|nr:acetylxylan esterase [Chitinophagaceae bacterium]